MLARTQQASLLGSGIPAAVEQKQIKTVEGRGEGAAARQRAADTQMVSQNSHHFALTEVASCNKTDGCALLLEVLGEQAIWG